MTQKQYETWQKTMRVFGKLFRCHQISERSFFYKNAQFPLCARCTGIFLGFCLVGPVIGVFTRGNIYVSIALFSVMCLDGFLQLRRILPSTNTRRFVTGLGAGYALFSFILIILF